MHKILLIAAAAVTGCAASNQTAVSVCDLASKPNHYADRNILVRGVVLQTRHGRLLEDPACPDAFVAFGSKRANTPQGESFDKAVWRSWGPAGRPVTAWVKARFVYVPVTYPVRRLDNYQVGRFELGEPKPSP